MKEFSDRDGKTWRVWRTTPSNPNVVAAGFQQGWLTFESGAERRRLAPAPADWDIADSAKLRLWCRAATPAGSQ